MFFSTRNPWRAARFVLIVAFILGPLVAAQAATSMVDTSFINPNLNAAIYSIAVQSDGKILVAGNFTTAGPNSTAYGRVARFNADGSLDTGFVNPAANGSLRGIAVQSSGKIVIGGSFTKINDVNRSRIARLNSDGSLDTTFGDLSLNGGVNSLAVQSDDKIVIAGQFNTVSAVSRKILARLNSDGTLDTTFANPNLNSAAQALAVQPDGRVVVGGSFTTAGASNTTRQRVARFNTDGTLDTGFADANLGATVAAVALQDDGKVLIGGDFTTVGAANLPYARLARLNADGTVDTDFADSGIGGAVYTVTVQGDGKILVGGNFTTAGASSATYGRLARFTAAGVLDTNFPNPALNAEVRAITPINAGTILVGGNFQITTPATYTRLVRFLTGHMLSLAAPANGTVTSDIGGLACGATCSGWFDAGSTVTLTATAAAGYGFTGWGGGCAGAANPLTLTIDANMSCTATFTATGPTPMPPPAPPPAFVSTPVPVTSAVSTVGSGTGSTSFASSFSNPSSLVFTATQSGGAALPSWLTFDPGTVSFTYDVPLPAALPYQPAADVAVRAEARTVSANTIYPLLLRVAQVPVALTASGAGQTYASTIRMDFYAPRTPATVSAVSASLDGVLGNGRSGRSALSWDGGQVVFETAATNLFPSSPNAYADIVRYDGLSGNRDRLSQTAIPGGGVANAAAGASMNPAVSSDGRYAAFASDAPGITLIPTGKTRQVYRSALGYPRVPLDGQTTPAPELVSVTAAGVAGNAASDNPVLSQDGRYVAFDSAATNFGITPDGARTIWRKDLQTGALELVMRGGNPTISWDGRYIAGEAGGQVYLRDMAAGTRLIGAGASPRLTARADRLVFTAGDQVVIAEVASGSVRNLAAGDQPDISADGRFVVYRSTAGQIVVHDLDRNVGALVTQTTTGAAADGASWNPAISGDGGTVAFGSAARDLVQGNPAGGQAYIAANPLPLPDKTGYWFMAGTGNGQGWVMERWGNRSYVGGLAYDAQGRSQWLAGSCTLSGLTCSGMLTNGPAFAIATADTGNRASLVLGTDAPQTLTPFPIGGIRTTGFAGLPQRGWWYDPAANDGVGYFLEIDTQPQPDGSVAQVGYLAVLAYDPSGRQVWQTAQAVLAADLSFTGTLTQYTGGAPFGSATATTTASGTPVGQVRLTFDGTDRARITLPTGRSAALTRFRF